LPPGLKSHEVHLLIFQALKSPELGLRCWKKSWNFRMSSWKAIHWWSIFFSCNFCKVGKL